jgi:hypothetical protein
MARLVEEVAPFLQMQNLGVGQDPEGLVRVSIHSQIRLDLVDANGDEGRYFFQKILVDHVLFGPAVLPTPKVRDGLGHLPHLATVPLKSDDVVCCRVQTM